MRTLQLLEVRQEKLPSLGQTGFTLIVYGSVVGNSGHTLPYRSVIHPEIDSPTSTSASPLESVRLVKWRNVTLRDEWRYDRARHKLRLEVDGCRHLQRRLSRISEFEIDTNRSVYRDLPECWSNVKL
jgi:hypothetical protein